MSGQELNPYVPPQIKKLDLARELQIKLEEMKPKFRDCLPTDIRPEKFVKILLMATRKNPELLNCDRNSFLEACVQAAYTGLMPDGKEAVFIQYGKKVQYVQMIFGILKLIRNSGQILSITAQSVYEKDEFSHFTDENGPHLKHIPNLFVNEGHRGNVVIVYVLVKTKDGGTYMEVMTKEQIEKIRKVSKSGNSDAWKNWWEEMAKKTVLKRLSKILPMSTDDRERLHKEDEILETHSGESFFDAGGFDKKSLNPATKLHAMLEERKKLEARDAIPVSLNGDEGHIDFEIDGPAIVEP